MTTHDLAAGENDFLMTTTTANAARVMQHLEYFLTLSGRTCVHLTSVTDEWAGVAARGRTRKVLEQSVTAPRSTMPSCPSWHARRVDGAPVMVCRLFGRARLRGLLRRRPRHPCLGGAGEAGEPFGIVPYGLEALGTLRIEKGHVTGSEIDGRTTARDLHLEGLLSRKKPFIGSAMANREGLADPDRLSLVGVVSLDGRPLNGGAHVTLAQSGPGGLGESIGHLTAVCYSPALQKYVALALLRGGSALHGTRAFVSDPMRGRFGPVEIVGHHFFDPEGSRLHG